MSTWKALNVESDNESEDEIDNTKEIQIEEALKLYQTALKHHAEGPQSFEETAAAYKALFESEIFKYTESLSEYKRHELFGETLVFDSILQDDFEAGPVQATGANDSAPNTLPQILYLSYKNHGQFILETMQYWLRQHGSVPQQEGSSHVLGALGYFAEALDKEDTDLDLWLRTASVAAMLGSRRLTRFCLEAIMDGNDELFESLLRLPGLEEGFAGQQLRELVNKLEDSVSIMQKPLSSMKRKKLSNILKIRLNPYAFAPLPAEVADSDTTHMLPRPPERVTLPTTKWDWAGVGEAILRHYITEQSGLSDNIPAGSSINFNIPQEAESPELSDPEPATLIEETPPAVSEESLDNDANTSTEKSGGDALMEDQDKSAGPKKEEGESVTPQEAAPALSRKRSTDSAGLPETAEGGRSRSKRLRARESIVDSNIGGDTAAQETAKQLEDQLEPYLHADQCLYEIIKDIYAKLGVEGFGDPKKLRELVTTSPDGALATNSIDKTACDMYAALQSAGSKIAPVLLSGEPVDLGGASREAGLNAFLGYAKSTNAQACAKPVLGSEKLGTFARRVNAGWMSIKEVAFAWLEVLLTPGSFPKQQVSKRGRQSSYMQFRWAEDLKRHLVQIIVNIDDYVYERMLERINNLNSRTLRAQTQSQTYKLTDFDASQIEIVETLFELHLDIFSLIKHPHSGVDTSTQIIQSDRLERWSALARDVIQLRSACNSTGALDDLALRHIWASVFQMSVNDELEPDYVLFTMEELKSVFSTMGEHTIEVQNNAVMPELSVAAIDRELVRISMKDFFLKVFDQDEKDPVAVIESLEPILEPLNEGDVGTKPEAASHEEEQTDEQSPSTIANASDQQPELQLVQASPHHEMRKFLDSASVNLRLSLWQRLREAYEAIDYPPKVLSCYLRSIETLVGEFKTSVFQEATQAERQVKLISRLRIIDEVVVKVLLTIRDEKSAFDTLSYVHMQTSFSAVAELLHILYAGNMVQDLIRVGQLSVPRFEGLPSNTFVNLVTRLNDMQLRLWILQYYLLNEGISQNQEAFPTAAEDLFEFLRHVHHATGVRCFSHLSSQQFLRLVKDEILRLHDSVDASDRDNELSQVLYDLYGLKVFTDPHDCHEFGSVTGILDKRTSLTLLPFIMAQAKKVDIKDLPKTDLKATIEKVHASLGRAKQHDDITFNRKIISTYFKSAINPMSLYNALKGVGSLSTKRIPAEELVAASKGWYFMMGNIALNKFRSQKRMAQGPTEDLNYAQAFFVQDLEYSVDRWETWYRLAQANDAQLEEAVSWTADKMNNNSVELINFQRAAINCYTMAVACVVREGDESHTTRAKVAQMYTEFGNRIYSSTREPFSMSAFDVRENERRWFSEYQTHQTYQRIPFEPLSLPVAWKFASTLYKRAIRGNPSKWWNYYMLGKCLWKMYYTSEDRTATMAAQGVAVPPAPGPSWEEVVDAFVAAIEMLPEKKGRGSEPILEPHYKLVSIVHKLFQRKAIDHHKGEEILKNTTYSQNLESPDSADDWERYILAVLKALRAADKSSWHHRIISRSAHVIYDDGKDMMVIHGAKHELTQQIFTKTMAVQVWKPENERPGRHFVYTSRYTKFFIHLLDQTADKANMEALAKRVRRKQTDFFEHSKLWQDLCLRYLKLLRRVGKIPDGQEDAVFKAINHDEFSTYATRMEAWCQNPATTNSTLDILRDAIELKRLNNGLMKPLLIDDLIGDTYGLLYTTIGVHLPPLPTEPQQQQSVQPAQPQTNAAQPPTGPLAVSSLVQGQMQVDGNVESHAHPEANNPFTAYQPNQMLQAQAQPQVEAAPRPRAKAVGRREVQRRAEACGQRPAGAISAGPVTTTIPIRSPTIASVLPLQPIQGASPDKGQTEPMEGTETGEKAESAQPEEPTEPTRPPPPAVSANDQLQVSNSGTATAAASVTNDERSAPASIHDDADDESELSELDESEVQVIQQEAEADERARRTRSRTASVIAVKPLFPNLLAGKNRNKPEEPESETGDTDEDNAEEGDEEEDDGKGGEEEL